MSLQTTTGSARSLRQFRPHFQILEARAFLEVRRGQAKRLVRPLFGPIFLVGAARDCHMVLGDPQFAEVHFYLSVEPQAYTLRHLGATPEITINGRAVDSTRLLDGDRIRTGPFEFVFHLDRTLDEVIAGSRSPQD